MEIKKKFFLMYLLGISVFKIITKKYLQQKNFFFRREPHILNQKVPP